MVKSLYFSEKLSDFDETCYITQILNMIKVKWRKIVIFKIQNGGARHLKNRFSGHYSSTNCSILAKFCTNKQNGMLLKATGQKLQIFIIQDGGRLPFWKSLKEHSGADWSVFFSRSIKSLIYNIFIYNVWLSIFTVRVRNFKFHSDGGKFWTYELCR